MKNVEELLFGIPIDNLRKIIESGIKLVGDGTKIERKSLEIILRYEIPILRSHYESLSKDQANDIIEELICQGYLKDSNVSPSFRIVAELYFELEKK